MQFNTYNSSETTSTTHFGSWERCSWKSGENTGSETPPQEILAQKM